jgi:hypothetical protein
VKRQLLMFSMVAATYGCFPYVAGTTAQTIPRGERQTTASVFVIPNVGYGDHRALLPLIDYEWRWGLNDAADIGVRITSLTGASVNYKKRLAGFNHPDSAATAMILGAGLLTLGQHGMAEATLITSLKKRGKTVPYAGLKAMYAAPLMRDIVRKSPSGGMFFGVRIGNVLDAILPEIAVYYDEPMDDFRVGRNVLIVPSISIRGYEWLLGGRR